MERELVGDKQWLTRDEMREGIAVCRSLPGPVAIQVGIWISYIRGGFWGAWAGGWAFILPNFVIVAALGALYVRFEGLPAVAAIFYGVSPAVIALILHSCYGLTKLGMKDWLEWAFAATAFVITVAVQAEVALVFIGCGIISLLYYGSLLRGRNTASTTSLMIGMPLLALGPAHGSLGTMLGKLLMFFLGHLAEVRPHRPEETAHRSCDSLAAAGGAGRNSERPDISFRAWCRDSPRAPTSAREATTSDFAACPARSLQA